jgi:protein disulfide-isomerase A1
LVVLALLASVSFAYEEEDEVLVLTDETFEQALQEFSDGLLVKFYAPWCGHCKKMAPDYASAARRLRNQDPPINIAKLDATAHTETATKYNVRGYPTLKFFSKGSVVDFNAERNEQGITNWVLKKMGDAVILKDSLAAF